MKKIIFILLVLMLPLVSAGKTTFNQAQNFTIGDCWNDRTITEINEFDSIGYTIYWKRGCIIENTSEDNITPIIIPEIKCEKISGDGNINVFVYGGSYDKDKMIEFGEWVITTLKNEIPFNETTYTLYYEKDKYACRGVVNEKQRDFRIGIGYAWGYRGWGEQGYDGKAGEVIFYNYEMWRFLLMHELGHVYGLAHDEDYGITSNFSIMSINGGDQEFREWQIKKIRENLTSSPRSPYP